MVILVAGHNAHADFETILQQAKSLPKVELHRHLEGSLRLSTMLDLVKEYNLPLPQTADELKPLVQVIPTDEMSSDNFLSKFRILRQFFLNPDVVERITHEAIEDAALDNVQYLELRFTPKALCAAGPHELDTIVPLVCRTAEAVGRQYNIKVRLIVSINRHEPIELGETVLKSAIAHMDRGVVGFDLAGDEANYSALPFRNLFRRAKDAQLGVTIHAGEWADVGSIWDAIGNCGAERVGHGINLVQDTAMMAMVAQRGITLEVCPTSNVYSGITSSFEAHPLHKLTQANILTTINTDDPSICSVTLSDELAKVMYHLGLSLDEIKEYTLRAARAAFLPSDEKYELVRQLQQKLALTT